MTDFMHQVLIVGGGLSGLACARTLAYRGIDFRLLEASDRIGGRMGSMTTDGVVCDLGFQVSMSNYHALEQLVPRRSLPRHRFVRGAVLVMDDRRIRVVDPKSEPWSALKFVFSGIGGWRDLRAANRCRVLAAKVGRGGQVEGTARSLVESIGFSRRFLDSFITPFFSGVLLDGGLDVPATRFLSTLDRFAHGHAEIPSGGMQSLAEAMANPVRDRISTDQPVVEVGEGWVKTMNGDVLTCEHVILALPFDATCTLAGLKDLKEQVSWSSTAALHFTTTETIPPDPIIYLNATGSGRLNLACAPSMIAPGYAPDGQHSIVASLNPWQQGEPNPDFTPDLIEDVRTEAGWLLGVDPSNWKHIQTTCIPQALPNRSLPQITEKLAKSIHATGDWTTWPSIDTAVAGGVKLIEQLYGRSDRTG